MSIEFQPMDRDDIRAYCKQHAVIEKSFQPQYNLFQYSAVIKFPFLVERIECSSPDISQFAIVSDADLRNHHFVHVFFTIAISSFINPDLICPPADFFVEELVELILSHIEQGFISLTFKEESDGLNSTITYFITNPLKFLFHVTSDRCPIVFTENDKTEVLR